MKDLLKFVLKSMTERKTRAYLTILGIMIGIAAVVSLVSLGSGITKGVDSEFAKLGGDKLIIQLQSSGAPGSSTSNFKLTDDDVKTINRINGIDETAGIIFVSGELKHNDQIKYQYVIGMSTGKEKQLVEEVLSYEIIKGRGLKSGDDSKIVLGYNYQFENKVFKKPLHIGDKILMNGHEFEVIGFNKQLGNPSDDANVFITEDALKNIFKKDDYAMVVAKVSLGVKPGNLVETVKKELRKSRNEEKGKETFFVQTLEQLIESFTKILGILNVVLIMIAMISLVVGGIGIMNVMFTSILERTKDIGVMKAIGAQNSQILQIFMIEAGILGLVGALLGIILGYAVSFGLAAAAGSFGFTIVKSDFSFGIVFWMLAFGFIVGCIAGIVPAYRASKLKPVDALRYE